MRSTAAEFADPDETTVGFVGRIPIRNIWLLMLYGSELYRELAARKVAVEENPDEIPNLIAEMLCHTVEKRLRRNLSFGYQRREAIIGRVRGRIDILRTERHQLLAKGQIACRYEDLTVNTPRNRYVRTGLISISSAVTRQNLRHRCRSLAGSLEQMGVIGERPSSTELASDRFGRHDADDRYMVEVTHLAFDMALPTEEQGMKALPSPDREKHWLRRLFERGVGGLYSVALGPQGWKVHPGKPLSWQIDARTKGIDEILPSMRTDIYLQHDKSQRRIIIDTKFNSILTKGWYREKSLRSGYVYQIYGYLRSQESEEDLLSNSAAGMLLHPAVGGTIDESAVIQGHSIRFATVDLTLSAVDIRDRLLNLVETLSAKTSP